MRACFALASILSAVSAFAGPSWSLGGVAVSVPDGWRVEQTARSEGAWLLGASRGGAAFQLRIGRAGDPVPDLIAERSRLLEEERWELVPGVEWRVRAILYRRHRANGGEARFSVVFSTELSGRPVHGRSRAGSLEAARETARAWLAAVGVAPAGRSLTSGPFFGKKYYLGFGDHLSGFMGNEVKYDISHTHDIFTKEIGGAYIGTKLVGPGIGASQIRGHWSKLKADMLWHDMFVQYSSGHGFQTGLAIGVSYDEIRDAVLSLPARELIVFTMACHSGGLVDSFNRKRAQWAEWGDYGRTLFVMASSRVTELSSTGPVTDPQEPGGPAGSAGSAFGHALWKALIGHADGHGDGVKDGYIALGEIVDYVVYKTQQVGGHTPVVTGVYSRDLVMNRVPSREALELLEEDGGGGGGGGEGPVPIARLGEWQVASEIW